MHQTVVRVVIEMWNVTSFDEFDRKRYKCFYRSLLWKERHSVNTTCEKYWISIDELLFQTQWCCCCQDRPTFSNVGAGCSGRLTSVEGSGHGLCQSYYPDMIEAVATWNFRHLKNEVSPSLSIGATFGKMRCPAHGSKWNIEQFSQKRKILSFLATGKLPFIASSATYNPWW